MTAYVLAFLIGVVAGLRSLTAPAVVSWAARFGWLHLEDTGLAFLGYTFTPWVLSVLAIGELIADKLPKTPSRKAPPGFVARLVTGSLCGAALGAASQGLIGGLVAGVDRRGGGDAGRLRGADPAGQSDGREGSADRAAGGRGGDLRGGLDRGWILMTRNFDAIIIGTGQAGPSLARRLAAAGMKVAIVERKLFGGTCVNTGCIPTKTMVASAYAAHMARRAAEFGVNVDGGVSVDMRRVKARKDAISGQVADGRGDLAEEHGELHGLRGPRALRVAARGQRGRRTGSPRRQIFINVGGRAVVPQMPGLDQVPYLTNSSMMEVDFLPRHLIVVGGSYIGLEFGQMFRRFGSEVTIIEMGPRLMQREDEDVSAAIAEILEREGIDVRLNAKCIAFSRRGRAKIVAHVECAEGAPRGQRHRTCCWRWGGARIPTIWGWKRPASRWTRTDTSWWTINCAPACRASGRWAIATARARSRTLPTTISRSWRRTCWTTTRGASATASRPTRCISIRRWGAPA